MNVELCEANPGRGDSKFECDCSSLSIKFLIFLFHICFGEIDMFPKMVRGLVVRLSSLRGYEQDAT